VTGDGEKETADENEEQAEEEADLPIQQPMKMLVVFSSNFYQFTPNFAANSQGRPGSKC
jgi:hypothetical protein